jgi:hypothetical protein
MGGDILIGAMSTGRQDGQRTSDSRGIERFDVEVDNSSQLQTMNSTNNTLEEVMIVSGDNDTARGDADDTANGDLTIRGVQFPSADDSFQPGAVPQQDAFGLNDVRKIDAQVGGIADNQAGSFKFAGSLDLTLALGEDALEKYFDLDDTSLSGNVDDIIFDYDLSDQSDEFLLNIEAGEDGFGFIDSVGVGGSEDARFDIDGHSGNDVIVTNVGNAFKRIDEQGQDYYALSAFGLSSTAADTWYPNHVVNNSAEFFVDGGAGADSILTHGFGNFDINAGVGADVVYTDNSGAALFGDAFSDALRIDRNIDEHTQIDYMVDGIWTLNDDNPDADLGNLSGSTNTSFQVATADEDKVAGTGYVTKVTVGYRGAEGADETYFTSTIEIGDAQIGATGNITEQVYNQAIKRAINNDPALNKVLEAIDGPGQSLIVYSKIDGGHTIDDFYVQTFEEVTTGGTTTVNTFQNAGGVNGQVAQYATLGTPDVGFDSRGFTSFAESDNTISIVADGAQDVTVLSTHGAFGEDAQGSNSKLLNFASNELLEFADGAFGNEVLINFDEGNSADTWLDEDVMDFLSIDYSPSASDFSQGAANTNDDSVSILAEANDNTDTGDATANNNSAGKVADLFDSAADNDADVATTEHIVIVYDNNADTTPDDNEFDVENNKGTVYLVTDTDGAEATATELGTVDLVGTAWETLTYDNFG